MASKQTDVGSPGSKIGKKVTLRMPPDDRIVNGIITHEIGQRQSDDPTKEMRLQRVQFEGGRVELRFGYYIIGKKPGGLGRWLWGQYAPLMPIGDVRALIWAAEAKGWL